jgi:hypothetical protein
MPICLKPNKRNPQGPVKPPVKVVNNPEISDLVNQAVQYAALVVQKLSLEPEQLSRKPTRPMFAEYWKTNSLCPWEIKCYSIKALPILSIFSFRNYLKRKGNPSRVFICSPQGCSHSGILAPHLDIRRLTQLAASDLAFSPTFNPTNPIPLAKPERCSLNRRKRRKRRMGLRSGFVAADLDPHHG